MDALKNLNLNNIDLNNIDLSKLKVNTQGYDAVELSPEHEEMIRGVGQMIDDVQKSGVLTCDKECQRNKKEQLLYDDYLNAKQNAEQAPIVLEEAERNFYEYSKGTAQYNKLKEKEYTKDATTKANQIAKEYLVKLENTLELYKQYQTQQTYLSNMETTKSVLQQKVNTTEKEIGDYKNTRELNDRMDIYTQDKIGWSTWISKILNVVYYLLAAAFGFTFIFLNKQYTNKKLWAITIALLLYPTVSSFVFDQIKRRL
jgi:lipopolysaccharide export LptBFGC system permease protein LptF